MTTAAGAVGDNGRNSPPSGLSTSLTQRADSLFSLLDTGGCGYLTQADLARCCGDDINVADVFAQLDTDGDGRIDAADFQSAIGLLMQSRQDSAGREQEDQLCSKSYSQEDGLNAETPPPTSPTLFDDNDEDVEQLTCRDQVSELHRQLGRQCPQLLDTFELVMTSVARDVGAQARERRQLEESYQRVRVENEKHVKKLEEEAEAQMARMEQLARERERRRLEEEYQELLRTKEREVGQLRQMMELMQAESANQSSANDLDKLPRRRRQRQRGRSPESELADDGVEEKEAADSEAGESANLTKSGRLMKDMCQLETALALSSSEVARLRQDRDDGERELQLERDRLRERQREQERLTRQLQLLHDANRSLNDTNDSLRAALERQRSVASSVASGSASASAAALSVLDLSQPHEAVLPAFDTCEEDDDPDFLLDAAAAAAEADSGTSTFREQPTVDNSSGGSGGGDGGGSKRAGVFGLSSSGGPSDPSASEIDYDDDEHAAITTAMRPTSLALNLQRRRRRRRPDDFNDDDVTDEGGDSSDGGRRRRAAHPLSSSPRFLSDADSATVDELEPDSWSATPSTPSPLGQPERMFRIVMAGDAAVGKTCFITRFCEGRFDSGAVSTLGVDFKTRTVKVDGRVIAVQLWDTAGQERFRSIAKSYFRRADGVILVYDCTSDRSFVSVRDWVESIQDSCCGGGGVGGCDDSSSVPIMIVANKTDLREAARERSGCAQRVIETDEGRRLAELFSAAIFVEASARSGDNVSRSVIDLCRLLQQREDLAVRQTAADAALELHAGEGEERTAKKRLTACCD